MSSIHPTVGTAKIVSKAKNQFFYHFITSVLNYANLLPSIYTSIKNIGSPSMDSTSIGWFAACFVLVIPLVFEYLLDVAVSTAYPMYYRNIEGSRFGHALILFSLFMPLFVLLGLSNNDHTKRANMLFGLCFICLCRSVATSAIFGKLQVFGHGNWNMTNTMLILLTCLGSQLFYNFGYVQCGETIGCTPQRNYVIISFFFSLTTLFLHIYFSRKTVYVVLCACFRKKDPKAVPLTANEYTCCVLLGIAMFDFTIRMLTMLALVFIAGAPSGVLAFQIFMHVFVALMAVVLPGRMIRRGMVALKVSLLFYMCVCLYVFLYVFMYVCMYVCMFVSITIVLFVLLCEHTLTIFPFS